MRELIHAAAKIDFDTRKFVHYRVMYKENGRYFNCILSEKYGPKNPLDLEKIDQGREFFPDAIWPEIPSGIHILHSINEKTMFLKTPNIVEVGMVAPEIMKKRILNEIKILEQLKSSPHPNIAEYLGCLVENGQLKGICLKRYESTMMDRFIRGEQASPPDYLMQDISRGVAHLHALNIVHGDLNPANVMFDEKNKRAVIIDMDAAWSKGELLPDWHKGGTPFYTRKAVAALPKNDEYSQEMMLLLLKSGMQAIYPKWLADRANQSHEKMMAEFEHYKLSDGSTNASTDS